MPYGDFKDLTRRTAWNKTLHDKALNIPKYQKYDQYQRGLASMVHNFLDKKILLHMQINLVVMVLKIKISQSNN